MIAGVAAGIAARYSVDATLVRLGFVAAGIVSGGTAILAYLVGAIVMPRQEEAPGLTSLRHNVDDLVSRGRELYGETRKVVDRNASKSGQTASMDTVGMGGAADETPDPLDRTRRA
jgi:phage shock protein PspC (stress-responsive transcriptional regulator)